MLIIMLIFGERFYNRLMFVLDQQELKCKVDWLNVTNAISMFVG